jgi:hypothetical protein
MSQQYDNTDRGALFKNDRKETENHPDYTGQINVGGVDYWLSAWIKEGRSGKFMSLSIKPKEEARKPAQGRQAPPARGQRRDDDDDGWVPF